MSFLFSDRDSVQKLDIISIHHDLSELSGLMDGDANKDILLFRVRHCLISIMDVVFSLLAMNNASAL